MSKRITRQDILDMAVNKLPPDMAADVNQDGKITPEDARLAPDGIDVEDALMSRELMDRLMTMPDFGYDREEDPLYRQYRDMYERAGEKAAENAFGLAASYTGGYGNTYAASAANDAYAMYMDRLAAKGEALEQQAYDRYRDDRSDLYRRLEAAAALEKESYDRAYQQERDRKDDAYREDELRLKEQSAEQSRLDALIGFAFDAADKGDFSYLDALGVDTGALRQKETMDEAAFYARYGDLSGLKAMGVDVSRLKKDQLFDVAALFAKYGNYSLLKLLA